MGTFFREDDLLTCKNIKKTKKKTPKKQQQQQQHKSTYGKIIDNISLAMMVWYGMVSFYLTYN